MKIADNIIGNILGKSRLRGGKNDWDGDGIRNKKDCQPRNTMRQDGSWKAGDVVWREGKAKVTKASTVGWYYAGYADRSSGPYGTFEGAVKRAKEGKNELG